MEVPAGSYGQTVTLDHESGEPLYLQLAALLRTRIEAGELAGRVPSARSLTQEHGVSHITAEKALGVLKEEGLIRPVIGKGFYTVPRS